MSEKSKIIWGNIFFALIIIMVFVVFLRPRFIILFLAIFLYFLPSIIAFAKEKKNAWAIFALNLFGITVICWIVALIWSLTYEKPEIKTDHKE